MIKSYFDLEAIGADEELVPVTFVVPSFSLAKDVTVRSAEGEAVTEVAAGNTATLPIWAARALRKGGFAAVRTPPKYSLSTFREFKNDPLAPNLHAKSPYFYDAGLILCALLGNPAPNGALSPEGNRLAAQLFRLYQLRYLKILFAAAKKGFDLNDEREKLSESERFLLDTFLKGQAAEQLWYSSTV